jgi:hypothetical protein
VPARPDRVIQWAPRIIGFVFAAFLAVFALDVFGESLEPMKLALALFMHLIPTWLVLLVIAVSWRREWIAALLLPLLAIAHVWTMHGRLDWTAYAIVDGPLILLALMYWLAWRTRVESRAAVR